MKIPEYIKSDLQRIMTNAKSSYMHVFDNFIEQVGKSTTFEEVMRAKKVLLLEILEGMPLSSSACPFCLAHRGFVYVNCDKCEYGKVHRKCHFDLPFYRSDYMRIMRAKGKLYRLIRDRYYHKGEHYHGEQY